MFCQISSYVARENGLQSLLPITYSDVQARGRWHSTAEHADGAGEHWGCLLGNEPRVREGRILRKYTVQILSINHTDAVTEFVFVTIVRKSTSPDNSSSKGFGLNIEPHASHRGLSRLAVLHNPMELRSRIHRPKSVAGHAGPVLDSVRVVLTPVEEEARASDLVCICMPANFKTD